MDLFNSLGAGFFNTVYMADHSNPEENSWLRQIEVAADVCRAPSRWLAAECWGGGRIYVVHIDLGGKFPCSEKQPKLNQGIQKVLRIIVGLLLGLPGQLLAVPLMAIAYMSEEIRLKHKLSVMLLTKEERGRLDTLIDERQKLAKGRQGCEPVSCSVCLLFSICCLLCCLVVNNK